MAQGSDLLDISNRSRFEALRTDAKVGLTFALSQPQPRRGREKRIRNQANARKAYDAVLRIPKKRTSKKQSLKNWRKVSAD